jgi:hypothetical protein
VGSSVFWTGNTIEIIHGTVVLTCLANREILKKIGKGASIEAQGGSKQIDCKILTFHNHGPTGQTVLHIRKIEMTTDALARPSLRFKKI